MWTHQLAASMAQIAAATGVDVKRQILVASGRIIPMTVQSLRVAGVRPSSYLMVFVKSPSAAQFTDTVAV